MSDDHEFEQLNLFDAKVLRDEGMDRVLNNSPTWFQHAMRMVDGLRDWTGTGEDLRLYLIPLIGEPHHRNAWGALTAQALRRNYLRPTGERVQMRTLKSHARSTDVYRSRGHDGIADATRTRHAADAAQGLEHLPSSRG